MNLSKFNVYTIGEVAKDKVKDALDIEVWVKEIMPDKIGNTDEKENLTSVSNSYSGKVKTAIVDKTKMIKARWFPYSDPNRVTPPDVCKGEPVLIFTYAGIDDYLWTTFQSVPAYRKLEKAVWLFSDNKSMESKDTLEDAYRLEIDTYDKQVWFHTATANDEYTTWDMQWDTGIGQFTLIDGKQNEIQIQSFRDRLNISIRQDADILIDNDTTYYNGHDYTFHNGNNITIKNGLKVVDLAAGQYYRCESSQAEPVIPGTGIIDIENGKDINLKNWENIDVLNMKNITVTNIKDVKVDVFGRTDITTMGLTIGSMGDEILQWNIDLCNALMIETHIGSGVTSPASVAIYTQLMMRMLIMQKGLTGGL